MKADEMEIDKEAEIIIISGEGEGPGCRQVYKGKRTPKAIKARLTKERAKGDRWARALQRVFEGTYGIVWKDLESGEHYIL